MPTTIQLPPGVVRRTGLPIGKSLEFDPKAGFAPPVETSTVAWLAAVQASPDYAALLKGALPAPAAPAAVVSTSTHKAFPPQPEVTVLSDVPLSNGTVLMGNDLGRMIDDATEPNRTQAVIEFHGFGLAVYSIVGDDNLELWVADAGGKITVQRGKTHVTVYNLDEARAPLTALTAYDAKRTTFSNQPSAAMGPIFAAHYVPEREFVLTLNPNYINRPRGEPGVKLAKPPSPAERSVRIALRPQLELGSHLYTELFNNPDVVRAFVRLNVRVLPAPGGVELGPAPGEKADLRDRRNLVAAVMPGRPLFKRLYG